MYFLIIPIYLYQLTHKMRRQIMVSALYQHSMYRHVYNIPEADKSYNKSYVRERESGVSVSE